MAVGHYNLGHLLAKLERQPEAEAEYRAAETVFVALVSELSGMPGNRRELERSLTGYGDLLSRLGKVQGAAAAADRVLAGEAPSADAAYSCALIFALSSSGENNADADARAARAVVVLRKAFAAGFRDMSRLFTDADLNPLRRRDDYAALLWELADGLPAAK